MTVLSLSTPSDRPHFDVTRSVRKRKRPNGRLLSRGFSLEVSR